MRHSTRPGEVQRGCKSRGAVKEILTCLNQHRKQPLTQIQPQVASTFSLLLFSSVCGTLCGLSSSSSCCDMHYLCRICPTTERQPCGRKLTIWHHDKRALATMMHACQSPDRLPTPTPTPTQCQPQPQSQCGTASAQSPRQPFLISLPG